MQVISRSVKDTLNLGRIIAQNMPEGGIVLLKGKLGAGKTVLAKGIAQGLGIKAKNVTSSSFVLIRQHLEGRIPLYHFDLYRITDPIDIIALGYEEYFYDTGVCVIEWPQRLFSLMPKEYIMVELMHAGESKRKIKLTVKGASYNKLLRRIREDIGA